jgi:aspartate ammonia-lyase
VAKEALESGRGVYDVVMSRGLLTRQELDRLLDPEAMTGRPAGT